MYYYQQLITPILAKQILEKNISNRRVSNVRVNTYYLDMINNRWRNDVGDTIKISETNRLLDGQHRLLALIKANISIMMTICSNLKDDVMPFIDTGKARNASDVFKIEGVPNDSKIPSIITVHERLKLNTSITGGRVSFTNFEILQMYYEKPEYWQTVIKKATAWYMCFGKIVPPSMIGGIYSFFIYKQGAHIAELFMNMLFRGTDISNNTIVLLRNRLIQDGMSKSKISAEYKTALIIKTWNAFLKGKELKSLKYTPETESYPRAL
jgi:hypothetical protein